MIVALFAYLEFLYVVLFQLGAAFRGGVHVVWGFDRFLPGVGTFLSVGFCFLKYWRLC